MSRYILRRAGGDGSDGDDDNRTRTIDPVISNDEGEAELDMELKSLLKEIEEKLADASRRRFTGEIRLTFNVSQGGFSTSYIEKERENLVKKRK